MGVDGVGLLGLVVGLWLALPNPALREGGRDTPTVLLAWSLVGLASLLLLTSILDPPARLADPGGVTATRDRPTMLPTGLPGYGPSGAGQLPTEPAPSVPTP